MFSSAVSDRPVGHDLLRVVAEGTAGAVGEEFLAGLVRNVAEALGARTAFVAEAIDVGGGRVRALSVWSDGDYREPFEYDTVGQPCALVTEQPVVAFPEALTQHFPEDQAAIEMGLVSYLAVCLRAADGTHLGHLAVLDGKRMEPSEEDIAALRIFASRAAAELERRRQADALAASRARVIEAADAARRRVGRDLHDGAQQRLLAVSNFLRVARRNLGPDAAAVGMLELAEAELSAAHADLRELARGLYPVALAERGLASAIESLASGCEFSVDVDVSDDDVPSDAALTAYFVVAESLSNAAKYANATSARARVWREGGELRIEVSDDGAGGADPAAGTGLRGLSDRVEVLGGRLEVDSPPGSGTRISAAVPLN
jgi:signal transduction histidine kinase